jgi:hypothetical protein
LGKLRDEGIFIASHRTKGMYIIKDREDAEKFYLQYAKRVATENNRLLWLHDLIEFGHWDKNE